MRVQPSRGPAKTDESAPWRLTAGRTTSNRGEAASPSAELFQRVVFEQRVGRDLTESLLQVADRLLADGTALPLGALPREGCKLRHALLVAEYEEQVNLLNVRQGKIRMIRSASPFAR